VVTVGDKLGETDTDGDTLGETVTDGDTVGDGEVVTVGDTLGETVTDGDIVGDGETVAVTDGVGQFCCSLMLSSPMGPSSRDPAIAYIEMHATTGSHVMMPVLALESSLVASKLGMAE
jgi:hypothetical protein